MLRCHNCRAQQYDGSIFCTECGASVLSTERRTETTASLGGSGDNEVSATPLVVPAPVTQDEGKSVQLTVINSGRRLSLSAKRPLLVGRRDSARGVFPDVDLSDDGGYDAGVSRRHAQIWHQVDGCLVEDLQSANGTFVNGNRLTPNQPIGVQSGDEIGFGTLLVRIEIS